MRRPRARRLPAAVSVVAAAVALVFAAGCVSLKRSPSARTYVLAPLPASAEAPPAPAAAPLLGVMPVRLPGWLDRPQLVTRAADHEVQVHEGARWAEPLEHAVTRTLAESLAALLPESRVAPYPWDAASKPLCRIEVRLGDFSRRNDAVRLEAQWALLPPDAGLPLARGRTQTVVAAAGPGDEATVAALSEALAHLARDLATAVRRLPETAAAP